MSQCAVNDVAAVGKCEGGNSETETNGQAQGLIRISNNGFAGELPELAPSVGALPGKALFVLHVNLNP